MFIAFEGPDNTGKTTSAVNLASDQVTVHEVTKPQHLARQQDELAEPDLVITYDRIVWLGHMVYRLALPEHEWNDDKVRVVFAMPDTHLVFKLHRPDLAQYISDELYANGKLAEVNPMYYYFARFLMELNETRGFTLFKSVSLIEVSNNPRDGTFTQQLRMFSSPVTEDLELPLPITDQLLLDLLRNDDRQR